jgi:iron complex outermembrane recepter protein
VPPVEKADVQAVEKGSREELAEIVVTATKRLESVNTVGMTITAISGAELQERDITSLADIAAAVSGLEFAQTANNTPILTMRGVGYNDFTLGSRPAVTVYVDQAPLPFPQMTSHSAYDLERIEVLKGPQGTLFGENSTGGAINYIVAKPTDRFEAGTDVNVGRFNKTEVDAFVSGPITDTLRARIAVDGLNSAGWQNSETRPGYTNGAQSYLAGRLLVDWNPSQNVRFELNVNGWQDSSQPQAAQFVGLYPQTPAGVHPTELAFPFPAQDPQAADWSTTPGWAPRSSRHFYQSTLRSDFDLPADMTLTSITAYDNFRQSQVTDYTGTDLDITDANEPGSAWTFSQELRLANSAQSGFRWLLGADFERSITVDQILINASDASNDSAALNFIDFSQLYTGQTETNWAPFANVQYDLTSQLTAKAGVRYTNSTNDATMCFADGGDGHEVGLVEEVLASIFGKVPVAPIGHSGPIFGRCLTLTPQLSPGLAPVRSELDQQNVSWTGGLDYKLDTDTLLYGNVSRGYKAGSFPLLPAILEVQDDPVRQESVTAYEIGVKESLFNRRLHFNAAAFYYNYNNKQVAGSVPNLIFGPQQALVNVPQSRIVGFDGDIAVTPVAGLTLDAAVTYLNSRVNSYTGSNAVGVNTSFAGTELPFAPRWSGRFDAEYRFSLPNGGVPFAGMTVTARSGQATLLGGETEAVPVEPDVRLLPGLIDPFTTNAYATLDLRVGYISADGRWNVMAYGKNITNTYYWNNASYYSDAIARFAAMPATWGVSVALKF